LIPREAALSLEFGCARATMNRALRELADEGVIERRRRAGTHVAKTPARAARVKIPLVRQEIEAQGAVYRYLLLERRGTSRSVPKSVQAKLMGGDGGDVVHVRCLHFADDAHFQYEDRWIYLVAVPDARAQDFSQFGPNEWLVPLRRRRRCSIWSRVMRSLWWSDGRG